MSVSRALFLFILMLPNRLIAQPKVEKLPETINSVYDEINPLVSQKDEKIFFTRVGHPGFDKTLIIEDKDVNVRLNYQDFILQLTSIYTQLGENPGLHPTASFFNQDIWQAESRASTFDYVTHPQYPLNNALPNSACAFSNG